MGGTSMVSRNGRKENLRQNGSDRNHAGRGAAARRGFDQWRASRHSARPATGDGVGYREEYSAGAVGILVGPGGEAARGRSHSSASESVVGVSVSENLFFVGHPGVGRRAI